MLFAPVFRPSLVRNRSAFALLVASVFLASGVSLWGKDYQRTVFGASAGTWVGSGRGASSPAGNVASFSAERKTVSKGQGTSRRWVMTILTDYRDGSSSGAIWTTRRLRNGTYHQASPVVRGYKVERWWQPDGKFREEIRINGRIQARSSGTWKMSGKKYRQRETVSFGGGKFTRQTAYNFPSRTSMKVTIKGGGSNTTASYQRVN